MLKLSFCSSPLGILQSRRSAYRGAIGRPVQRGTRGLWRRGPLIPEFSPQLVALCRHDHRRP
jgi:hypothetical protein